MGEESYSIKILLTLIEYCTAYLDAVEFLKSKDLWEEFKRTKDNCQTNTTKKQPQDKKTGKS